MAIPTHRIDVDINANAFLSSLCLRLDCGHLDLGARRIRLGSIGSRFCLPTLAPTLCEPRHDDVLPHAVLVPHAPNMIIGQPLRLGPDHLERGLGPFPDRLVRLCIAENERSASERVGACERATIESNTHRFHAGWP